jgi:hypothetical protein
MCRCLTRSPDPTRPHGTRCRPETQRRQSCNRGRFSVAARTGGCIARRRTSEYWTYSRRRQRREAPPGPAQRETDLCYTTLDMQGSATYARIAVSVHLGMSCVFPTRGGNSALSLLNALNQLLSVLFDARFWISRDVGCHNALTSIRTCHGLANQSFPHLSAQRFVVPRLVIRCAPYNRPFVETRSRKVEGSQCSGVSDGR